jgi:hypothetical protein
MFRQELEVICGNTEDLQNMCEDICYVGEISGSHCDDYEHDVWNDAPCSLVGVYRRFGGDYRPPSSL